MPLRKSSRKIEEEIKELEKEVSKLERASPKKESSGETRKEIVEETPIYTHSAEPKKEPERTMAENERADQEKENFHQVSSEFMPVSEELLKKETLSPPEEAGERVIRERSLMEVEGPVFVSVRRYKEILAGLKDIENATNNLRSLLGSMKSTRRESLTQLEECIENLRTMEERIENITRVLRID